MRCGAMHKAMGTVGLTVCALEVEHKDDHVSAGHLRWPNQSLMSAQAKESSMTTEQVAAAMGKEIDPVKREAKQFWMGTAEADFEKAWAKAVQRSAVDLLALGAMWFPDTDDGTKIKGGIAFYAAGKAARIAGRIRQGEDPNSDDVLDLRVYAFMLAYVEQFGGWPWPV